MPFHRTVFTDEDVKNVSTEIRLFKDFLVQLFGDHYETGLFTIKFNLLDHLADD